MRMPERGFDHPSPSPLKLSLFHLRHTRLAVFTRIASTPRAHYMKRSVERGTHTTRNTMSAALIRGPTRTRLLTAKNTALASSLSLSPYQYNEAELPRQRLAVYFRCNGSRSGASRVPRASIAASRSRQPAVAIPQMNNRVEGTSSSASSSSSRQRGSRA
jgi:hypothetical protein